MTTALSAEIATYQAQRAKLVEEHVGEYVLIKGDQIIGFYETEAHGLSAGYKRYANAGFLVRHVSESEAPVFFTSLYMGR